MLTSTTKSCVGTHLVLQQLDQAIDFTNNRCEMSRPEPNKPERRSQQQRSQTMRRRLIKATIACLSEQGYAGTTLSGIVRHAGVSRGAQVHHFASKNELILVAAKTLLANAYRQLGEVLLGIADEENRLRSLIFAVWRLIFCDATMAAFHELLVASRHDPELAQQLQRLIRDVSSVMDGPIDHYFEPCDSSSESPKAMFQLMTIHFTGLAAVAKLQQDTDNEQQIELIYRVMRGQMRARKNVTQPPPRDPSKLDKAV